MKHNPITSQGLSYLKKELSRLRNVSLPDVTEDIRRAREYGDLKENAEYITACNKKTAIEKRILSIMYIISTSQVIDLRTIRQRNKVIFGTKVTLVNTEDLSTNTYTIVGKDEREFFESAISVFSPLAQCLIGKFVGDRLKYTSPEGITYNYQIKSIRFYFE